MENKIIFTKSKNAVYICILLIVFLAFLLMHITDNFTALPDFQGGAKAVLGDVLLPIGICLQIHFTIKLFMLPKKIVIEGTTLIIDGVKITQNHKVRAFKASNDKYQIAISFDDSKTILTTPSYLSNCEYSTLNDMQTDAFNIETFKLTIG